MLVTTVRSYTMVFVSSLIRPLRWCHVADIKDLRSGTEQYTVKIDGEIDGIKQLDLTFKQLRDSLPRSEVLAVLVVRPRFHLVLPLKRLGHSALGIAAPRWPRRRGEA